MKISALIPTYNRRKYVARAIASILEQTVPVDEIIVVDDGSTDGTAEEIESRFGSRVRVVRQTNQGVSAARRRLVTEAQGEWVAFLDSDDEWTPERNRIFQVAIEKVSPNVAWIFGDLEKVTDGKEEPTQFQEHGLRVNKAVHVFDDALSVQHPVQFGLLQGSVIRRGVLLELCCFSEGLRKGEDILAQYQVACRYRLAAVPDIVTRFYRTSDLAESSLTADSKTHADYCRAMIEAYALAVENGRRHPWAGLHAEAVRALCKELGKSGQTSRRLSLQQFRYGFSSKSVAFFCAALLGNKGLLLWSRAAAIGRAA